MAIVWGVAGGCVSHERTTAAQARGDAPALRAAMLPAPALSVAAEAAMRRAADPTLADVAPETAEKINAARPFDAAPIRPMAPFVLKSAGVDRERAVECLTQAIYYEAAREPTRGQQAVAQVVLNRVRHPAYPKSVCAVVYQGSARNTGCQFTFTCDGAMRWAPQPVLWRRAEQVARRALGGYVDRDVGSATHYHAAYVAPYWAPTLVKMAQVGQHIFYRWSGAWGEPAAFTGRYDGRETLLTPAVLKSDAPAVPELRQVTLTADDGARVYRIAAAGMEAAARDGALQGVLRPARRAPTAAEVRRINDSLSDLEKRLDAPARRATAQAAVTEPAG